jgi:hypothetical protein
MYFRRQFGTSGAMPQTESLFFLPYYGFSLLKTQSEIPLLWNFLKTG